MRSTLNFDQKTALEGVPYAQLNFSVRSNGISGFVVRIIQGWSSVTTFPCRPAFAEQRNKFQGASRRGSLRYGAGTSSRFRRIAGRCRQQAGLRRPYRLFARLPALVRALSCRVAPELIALSPRGRALSARLHQIVYLLGVAESGVRKTLCSFTLATTGC